MVRSLVRASTTSKASPGTRKLVCRARSYRSGSDSCASLRKICRSGQYRMRVPVTPRLVRLSFCRLLSGVNRAVGPVPSKRPGTPRRKDIPQVDPLRSTSTSSREDSALTTEEPTPCSPPVALYVPEPNFPPACNLVKTTSTPDSPVRGSMSTGMPRAVSRTEMLPSESRVTKISLPNPARASSTALSMISQRQCMRPRVSVDPMYIAGRFRTASRPSRTSRCRAS